MKKAVAGNFRALSWHFRGGTERYCQLQAGQSASGPRFESNNYRLRSGIPNIQVTVERNVCLLRWLVKATQLWKKILLHSNHLFNTHCTSQLLQVALQTQTFNRYTADKSKWGEARTRFHLHMQSMRVINHSSISYKRFTCVWYKLLQASCSCTCSYP